MCRALKPKLHASLGMQGCGGAQTQAPRFSAGVSDWKVWEALRAIPMGQTRSYREIAVAIGQPTAVRAVARACAANPVAVFIPCHRVIRNNGELAGYRWGLERKRKLLAKEISDTERCINGSKSAAAMDVC